MCKDQLCPKSKWGRPDLANTCNGMNVLQSIKMKNLSYRLSEFPSNKYSIKLGINEKE